MTIKTFKFCLSVQLIAAVTCHVAFVYPSARYPPLDFLDSSRTVQPCGMPRPASPLVTDFVVGMHYNLTWSQSQPNHKGGVRINLLDSDGNKIKQLYPENDVQYTATHPVSASVTFTEPCANCIVQIQSQALEYGADYIFHSCGDVKILDAVTSNDDQLCSGNGAYIEDGQACSCYRGYSGSACQYRQDCQVDSDCGTSGKCLSEGHPAWILKTCYCSFGYFGKNCETEFKVADSEEACFNYENLVDTNPPKYSAYGLFVPECYTKVDLDGDDAVYSRTVKSDVEIILDFNTTGWAAIGWRPMGLDPSCRIFPSIGLPKSRTFRSTYDFQSTGMVKSAFESLLHPMDCTDIISVSVIDGRSRFQDMYSRDRSSPLIDSYFEGEFSLTAAFAVERDGRTVAVFRRNVREIEPSDHPLGPGKVHGIYAKATDGKDEFKYHGHVARGVKMFEFVKDESSQMDGALIYPDKETIIEVRREPVSAPYPRISPGTPIHSHEVMELSNDFQAMESEPSNPEMTHNEVAEPHTARPPVVHVQREQENDLSEEKAATQLNSISDSSSNELSAPALASASSNSLSHAFAITVLIIFHVFC